ncbi:MAG: hypothetical protein J6M20_07955 [Clostridia bacterium]|nr:hypothetical protein [Clostridia bacterium]
MKKFTAVLLALLMMALPVLGMAASPAEMIEGAAAAGQPIHTAVTFDAGTIPGLDAETAAMVNDLIDALGFTTDTQENQTNFAMQLSGTDVLTLAWATEGEDTYINSNLLGGTIAFNATEGDVIIDHLLKMAVDADMLTESDVAEVKQAIEQVKTQVNTQVEAIDLENLDMTALLTVVEELMEKVTTGEVTQQPKNSDPAATVITIKLTGEDIAKVYKVIFDVMKNVPQFTQALESADLTMNGEKVTADEMIAKLPELADQIGAMVQGEIPVEIYLDEAGEPVYGIMSMTMKAEDENGKEETITMDMDFARRTVNEGVTYAVTIRAEDANDEGVSITVDVLETEALTTTNVGVASIENGVSEPVITVSVLLNKNYGETKSEENMIVDVVVTDSDSGEEISFKIDMDSEAEVLADGGVQYEAEMDLYILGMEEELFTIEVEQLSGKAVDSIVTADAVRPGTMTEDEVAQYVNNDVMNALMNALMGLVQNLPASVLSLVMEM